MWQQGSLNHFSEIKHYKAYAALTKAFTAAGFSVPCSCIDSLSNKFPFENALLQNILCPPCNGLQNTMHSAALCNNISAFYHGNPQRLIMVCFLACTSCQCCLGIGGDIEHKSFVVASLKNVTAKAILSKMPCLLLGVFVIAHSSFFRGVS